ncbi:MAG: HAD family hydrolase [Methanoregulaceae archaeon]
MRTEREIRAVLFDLDNTLVRFIDAQRAACAAVIDLAGTGSVEDLFEFFLRPKHNFESHAHILDYLSTIASSCDPAMACARYEEVKLAALEPYEGARSTLERLTWAGVPMAVITDADATHAASRIAHSGLDHLFEVVVTPESTGERKPSERNFWFALDHLGVDPSEAAMVGDSLRRDIEPANNLGILSVHAAYGDWNPGYDCFPDHRLDEISRLVGILLD